MSLAEPLILPVMLHADILRVELANIKTTYKLRIVYKESLTIKRFFRTFLFLLFRLALEKFRLQVYSFTVEWLKLD